MVTIDFSNCKTKEDVERIWEKVKEFYIFV